MHQHTTAVSINILAGLVFQGADFLHHMAAYHRGIAPARGIGQSGGYDVFGKSTKGILVRMGFKGAAMNLPGLASQQQCTTLVDGPLEVCADIRMPIGRSPPTVGETAIHIFGFAAWRL